jgi:hypothetical protein
MRKGEKEKSKVIDVFVAGCSVFPLLLDCTLFFLFRFCAQGYVL